MRAGPMLILVAMLAGCLAQNCGDGLNPTMIHVWISNSTARKFVGLECITGMIQQNIGSHFGFVYPANFYVTFNGWPVDIWKTPQSQGLMRNDELKISDSRAK